MCKHLPMEPFGDPEARIRDLERPLADQAAANELGTHPYREVAPPTTPVPPYSHPPYTQQQYGSPYYAPPQRVVRKRSHTAALWMIPLVIVGALVAGVVAVVAYVNTGSPDSFTHNPSPPISGGGGPLDAPPSVETRIDSTEQIVTVEAGGFVSLGGVETRQTVVCDDGTVNISGVNNTIEVQGACTMVTVSGVENTVTVESADTISASGFNNRVTFGSGNPEISKSGSGNIVEPG